MNYTTAHEFFVQLKVQGLDTCEILSRVMEEHYHHVYINCLSGKADFSSFSLEMNTPFFPYFISFSLPDVLCDPTDLI